DKTRVTVLLTTNIIGIHKLKPLVLLLVDNVLFHTSPVENNSKTYINAIDELFVTEDVLSESEIVTMILADNKIENNTSSDLEKKEEKLPPPCITSIDTLNILKILIRYEEQFSDNETISQDKLCKRLSLYKKMCKKNKKQ
ncbi:1145_t:CDS:2, partial [Diversispora eburnea]